MIGHPSYVLAFRSLYLPKSQQLFAVVRKDRDRRWIVWVGEATCCGYRRKLPFLRLEAPGDPPPPPVRPLPPHLLGPRCPPGRPRNKKTPANSSFVAKTQGPYRGVAVPLTSFLRCFPILMLSPVRVNGGEQLLRFQRTVRHLQNLRARKFSYDFIF